MDIVNKTTYLEDLSTDIQLNVDPTLATPSLKKLREEMTLNEIFEFHADENPYSLAIKTSSKDFSYQEVEESANKIATLLREKNIGPGSLVGIYFNRGEKPIVSILAVLKSGAAYVPLDPSYPTDRIQYILDYANVSLLLTEDELSENISDKYRGETIIFDNYSLLENVSSVRLSNQITGLKNSDLSYILFTSGTTGRPKGIMTEHRNVSFFSSAFNKVCEITPDDKIYQGFALVFDGSVEEIWMAFGSGASLVVGSEEFAKLGEETANFMNQQGVTIFSTVPTFLSLIKNDLVTNRLIIVSGEPCPSSLIDIWSSDRRRMLNVYGPTETTVNTTVKECLPGEPVTIGKALEGYQTYVLDGNMTPVEQGEEGELYIGGVGLARGYYGLDDLTQKSYIANPFDSDGSSPRLYKTGDLVKELHGEIHFISRLDTQVKIRGFRIELSEIESLLMELEQINLAVVTVSDYYGQKKLAAYVTINVDRTEFNLQKVIDLLKDRLPSYMIPSFLDVLDLFPRLPSGKIDRKNLPDPIANLVSSSREIITAQNKYQKNLLTSWQKILKNREISITDDFFVNLGGDSLGVVEMLTDIRNEFGYQISIRDVYNHLTIEKLSIKVAEKDILQDKTNNKRGKSTSEEVFKSSSKLQRYLTYSLQSVLILLSYSLAPAPVIIFAWMTVAVIKGTFLLQTLIYITVAAMILGYPLLLLSSIALKWLIIGRYKEGRYRLWSFYYFRCWLTFRIQAAALIGGIAGTPLMGLYYRLMGAKIGKNTIIDSSMSAVFDLVTIGENSAIGSGTHMLGYRIEDGMMIIGGVEIGDNCYVGSHSHLGLNSKMKNGSRLDDLSSLPDNFIARENCSYRGSPPVEAQVDLSALTETAQKKKHPIFMGIVHLAVLEFVAFLFFLTSLPSISLMVYSYIYGGVLGVLGAMIFFSIFGMLIFCLMVAGIKAILMRKTVPGVYDTHSFYYVRKYAVDLFLVISSAMVHSLYTTIYLPCWLRLLGAKIGSRAEISTVTNMTPDLTIIEDESFFADGSMIGGRRIFNGKVLYLGNKIGRRSFVGNNAMLPPGESLGGNCLLGVLSTPPKNCNNRTDDNSEWLGSPSFKLPHRNRITTFSDSEIFNPTKKLYLQRFIIDGLRILIPSFIGLATTVSYTGFLFYAFNNLSLTKALLLAPVASISLIFIALFSVVLLKKIVMGTFKPEIKPLWSVYVWCNEMINGAYETIAVPLITPMIGTPFYNWYLRMMGCSIGKNSYIGTALFSEFDLVDIGDYCALNAGVIIQNHLFEDRVMKSSYLKINNNCSIGNMSVILYDTEIGSNSYVAPLSLVMKGDTLPASSEWLGIPIHRC